MGGEKDEFSVFGGVNLAIKSFIVFGVNGEGGGLSGNKFSDLPGSEGLFIFYVEENAMAVGSPDIITVGIFDGIGQVLHGLEVKDAEEVFAPSEAVHAVCEEPVVGADAESSEFEIGKPFSHGVAVEHDLFFAAVYRFSAIKRVFLSGFVAGVIPETTEPVGDGHIIFADASFYFFKNLIFEMIKWTEYLFAV